MTTPTGTIKFSDITSEFGTPSGKNLGAFRINQSIGDRSWPLDNGVPTSGTIKFSDLRGKTCNVVVDYAGNDILSTSTYTPAFASGVSHNFDDTANVDISFSYTNNARITIEPQVRNDPGGGGNTADRKHYLVTFQDGTVVASDVSNITIGSVSSISASGLETTMVLSSKQFVSSNSFRVWFADSEGENGFVKNFEIRWGGQSQSSSGSPQIQTIFTVSRNASSTNTITFSASGYSSVSFTLSNDSTQDVSRSIDVGVAYLVTGSGTLRIGQNGSRIELDDGDGNNDADYNDLTVAAGAGYFYQVGSNFYYILPEVIGTAKNAYDSSGVVVGGFKSLPASFETKKVHHVIRRRIGNGFSSGEWDTNTKLLRFIVTSTGAIYGAGGGGGKGANQDGNGQTGFDGGNALSLSYNSEIVVEAGGVIAGGGGGGGGGAYQYNGGPDARGPGSGGGGGAGFPSGSGGPRGTLFACPSGNCNQGREGSPGSLTTGGTGGPSGGGITGGGQGGAGGNGGNLGQAGGAGAAANTGSPGQGGNAGKALSYSGVSISLSNSGSIFGAT